MDSPNQPSILKRDLHALTGLRGIAAVLVMCYHYRLYDFGPDPLNRVVQKGYLSVDVFFALSGFVMAMTYSTLFVKGFSLTSYKSFWGRRFARIYPIYIITTIIALVISCYAKDGDKLQAFGDGSLAANLLLVQTWGICLSIQGPAWSISTEWFVYLIFPILASLCLYSRKWRALIAAVLAAAVLLMLAYAPEKFLGIKHYQGPLDIIDYAHGGALSRCCAGFMLGMLSWRLANVKTIQAFFQKNWVSLAVVALICGLFEVRGSDVWIVLLLPLMLLSLSSDKSLFARVLGSRMPRWLGDISYSIYLIHEFMWAPRMFLQNQLALHHIPHMWAISICATLALTLGVATLSYNFIEMPARIALRKAFERRPPKISGI